MNSSKFHGIEKRCRQNVPANRITRETLKQKMEKKLNRNVNTRCAVFRVLVIAIISVFCFWQFSKSTDRTRINKYATRYALVGIHSPSCACFVAEKVWKMPYIDTNHKCHSNFMTIFNLKCAPINTYAITIYAMESTFLFSFFDQSSHIVWNVTEFSYKTNLLENMKLPCNATLTPFTLFLPWHVIESLFFVFGLCDLFDIQYWIERNKNMRKTFSKTMWRLFFCLCANT